MLFMNRKKRKILIIAIAAVVAAAAIVGVAVFLLRGGGVRALNATQLSVGEKYLADLNYTRATATLQNVIKVEPNNTEAYLALARAYQYMGDVDSALETLGAGYEITNSTVIERARYEIIQTVNTRASSDGDPSDQAASAAPAVQIVEIAGRNYRTDITELVLRDCGLTNADMQNLAQFANLERLDISGNNISDISAAASLTNLKKFYAANNAVTDVSPLSGLSSLQYAGLRGNRISNADSLISSDSLLYLHLSDNNITNVTSPGRNMQLLYLAGNNINNTAAVTNSNLIYYDLSGNPGTGTGG